MAKYINVQNGILRMDATAYYPNPDAFYGPYESIDAAYTAISTALGENIPLGMKFGVSTGGKFYEYQFLNGTAKDDAVCIATKLELEEQHIISGIEASASDSKVTITIDEAGGESHTAEIHAASDTEAGVMTPAKYTELANATNSISTLSSAVDQKADLINEDQGIFADTYNGYKLGAACEKGVSTSLVSSTEKVPTSQAVVDALAEKADLDNSNQEITAKSYNGYTLGGSYIQDDSTNIPTSHAVKVYADSRSKVFSATYGSTLYNDITAALAEGKYIQAHYSDAVYHYMGKVPIPKYSTEAYVFYTKQPIFDSTGDTIKITSVTEYYMFCYGTDTWAYQQINND